MTKLTKDFMRDIIAGKGFGVAPAAVEEMAFALLEGMQKEPVGEFYGDGPKNWYQISDGDRVPASKRIPLYRHPQPAPAVEAVPVVDADLLHIAASAIEDLLTNKDRTGEGVWYDVPARLRRAAMQQPVCNRDELSGVMPDFEGVDLTQRECYQAGKARGLPDGWVMVPVEPTEDMIIAGFESEPDESFSKPEEWEKYEAMSGCQQAAHRARLCWSAMVAAAPQNKP